MPKNTIYNDLIPYRAGCVKVTELDGQFRPLFGRSYTTKRDFLTSTQMSETRTSESLPNGNGQDKEYYTGRTYNLAVVTQTYDPDFQAFISGKQTVSAGMPVAVDATITPTLADDTATVATYVFEGDAVKVPAAQTDGNYYFEIRDAYSNQITEAEDSSTIGAAEYTYDPDTKTLSFHKDMANTQLSVVYYTTSTMYQAYESDPIIRNKVFMVEVFGEMQSAGSGEITKYYGRIDRASVSGDVSGATTQKSISNAITYNFASAPMPEGVSPLHEEFFT